MKNKNEIKNKIKDLEIEYEGALNDLQYIIDEDEYEDTELYLSNLKSKIRILYWTIDENCYL